MPALHDALSFTCPVCGTPHHLVFGSTLPAECPACWEALEIDALYQSLRPKRRQAKRTDDSKHSISDDIKRVWKQSLPQFRDINSWAKLDGFDLAWILCVAPECVRHIPFKALDSEEWRIPLKRNEKLLKPYWTVCFGSSGEVSQAIRSDPSMIQFVDVSQRIEAKHWWQVLDAHPEMTSATPETYFSEMPPKTWVRVLQAHPDSRVEVKTPWASLSGSDWAELLVSRAELASHCDWHKLNENDWNAILSSPSTPPLWQLIHDVLRGLNLTCIVEHPELLKHLNWDIASLEGLRELIIASNLNIQPPSWDAYAVRIAGEKEYWQCRQSVRQFVPPTIPGRAPILTADSLERVDLTKIIKYENKLAVLCFMGWENMCYAKGGGLQDIDAEMIVKYPGIGERYGWGKLPAEMHYDLVRMAPWLREYFPWTQWSRAKLRNLYAVDSAINADYRGRHPFKYIFVRYEYLIYLLAMTMCAIGATGVYGRYQFLQFQNAIAARNLKAAETRARYLPSVFWTADLGDLRELKDLQKKTMELKLVLGKSNVERLVPDGWNKANAAIVAAGNHDDLQQAIIATSNAIVQLGILYGQAVAIEPLYREMMSAANSAKDLMAEISSHGYRKHVNGEIAELESDLISLRSSAESTHSFTSITKQIHAWKASAAVVIKSLNELTEAWKNVSASREGARVKNVPRLLPRGWELAEIKRDKISRSTTYEETLNGCGVLVDEYNDLVRRSETFRQTEADVASLQSEIAVILGMIKDHPAANHASDDIGIIQSRYAANTGTNVPPLMLYDSQKDLTAIRDDCRRLLGELNTAAAKQGIFKQKHMALENERKDLGRMMPEALADIDRKANSLASINKLSDYIASVNRVCMDIDAAINALDKKRGRRDAVFW